MEYYLNSVLFARFQRIKIFRCIFLTEKSFSYLKVRIGLIGWACLYTLKKQRVNKKTLLREGFFSG